MNESMERGSGMGTQWSSFQLGFFFLFIIAKGLHGLHVYTFWLPKHQKA
jgi:hypothetical protein